MKNLWLLLTSSSFLWVAWVEAYVHKGRSLWEVDSCVGRSWCLCVIMWKRDSLKEHVQMEVGMVGIVNCAWIRCCRVVLSFNKLVRERFIM